MTTAPMPITSPLDPESSPPGLFAIRGCTQKTLNNFLHRAREIRDTLGNADRRNGFVLTLFFENSTRTRTSFEIAARRLGLDTLNLDVSSSSISKGESLRDTIRTIDMMAPDFLIIRHSRAGTSELVAAHTRASVVNAGDGAREHPTQALLDAMTLCDRFGHNRLGDLNGLRIALIGDVAHSRVARSNLALWSLAGADIRLVGPQVFVPDGFRDLGHSVSRDLQSGLEGVDVAYTLRVQTERQHGVMYPSMQEYRRHFGLTLERLDRYCPNAVVLHPGPVNRGVEMDSAVLDDERCLVEHQVANGVWMRMAVLSVLDDARRELRRG